MVKVRLLTGVVGTGFFRECGEVIEVDDATAARYIERGLAEPVAAVLPPPAREAAAVVPSEQATKARPKKRKATRKQRK